MAFRHQILEEAVDKLRKAMLPSSASDELIEAVMALHHATKKLDQREGYRIFATIVPRISQAARSNPELKFALLSLQKVFDAEVVKTKGFKDEIAWFLTSRARFVEELRELMLGIDLNALRGILRLDSQRLLSVHSVIKASYFAELEKPFSRALKASEPRIKALLKQYESVVEGYRKTGEISLPHFWKLKGEITEILCHQAKLDILAEISIQHPGAQLIENVMAVTSKTRGGASSANKAPRQIWDGIIAVPTKDGLKILRIFEVKSGLRGFDEALEQVVETHVNRFVTNGDELRVTLKDGTSAVYRLGDSGKSGVHLTDSLNVMMHPSGESWMMPNQFFESGKMQFITRLIEVGKREITHGDAEALTSDFILNPSKYL